VNYDTSLLTHNTNRNNTSSPMPKLLDCKPQEQKCTQETNTNNTFLYAGGDIGTLQTMEEDAKEQYVVQDQQKKSGSVDRYKLLID